MRTRFLPPISSSSSSSSVGFLRFPLPLLPPPPPPPHLDYFHCFDDASLFTCDLQIEQLPIQAALSKFLSDAIPTDIEFSIDHQLEENDNGFHSEEKLLDMCSGDIEGVPNLEFRLPNYVEAERVVYTIDDLTSDSSIKQQSNLPEDDENALGIYQSSYSGFPVFEMDETYLELLSDNSRDGLQVFDESIEAQKCILEVEQRVNDMDTMGLAEFDLLENLSDHLELCATVEVPPLNFFQEKELIIAIEYSNTDGHTQEIVSEDLASAKRSRTFEELRSQMEACETVFSEAMNFENFSELVVSHELNLMDDSFKALPVPILLDHEQMTSSIGFIQKMLKLLEPQHSSMSDGLYLDWHFLVEDHGRSNEDSCGWKWLQDISYCGTFYDFDTADFEMLIYKFIVSDDVTDKSYSKEEYLKISVGYTTDAALRILRKDESKERETEPVPYAEPGSKNITFVESMSNLCDLAHLIPLESERRRENKPNSVNITAEYPFVFSSELSTTSTHVNMQLNQWNINLHPVKMSNDMLDLINNLHAAILENDVGVSKYRYPPRTEDDISHHSISEDKLQKWIRDKSTGKAGFSYDNNSDALLMVLRAIKQTAWYLLYYGVYAAYIYINKLCTTVELFRLKLSFLHQMFEEAHRMAQQDILKIHPSLAIVQEILQTHKSLKILIVAECVFWLPLKLLLTSMGLSYSEPHQQTPNKHSDKGYSFSDDDLLCTDCCLIFYEFISPSFPVNKYGVVLEYGGPLMSSRLSTMSPSTHGCVLHFIKVDFEDSSICSTICNGVQMPKNINYKLDGGLHCKETLNWGTDKIEELFSYIPYQESTMGRSSELVDKDEACGLMPANCVSSTLQKQECTRVPSSTKNIIIVNTLNIEKDMIICRRSTYQQILALEKSGSQVIERDLNFPVDVIINAAVCLAWYNSKNIGKKAALDDAISCLPIVVENLAASILMSLSFSFSGCIMVFEGGSSYIAGVMELSDKLYAAAASLGIDLQLFYSYSSEMTDEIILSCIKVATKSARDLCPKMSDSETLAESFLTTFPSINPLSAHAILSTGGNLVNFLEWSPECRIRAVQRLHVPESIALLSALSSFGEKESSLSGMTECSSSVSSGTESEYMHFKSNFESKKRKYVQNHQNVDIAFQNSVYQASPDLLSNRNPNPGGAFGPLSPELFHDVDKTDLVSQDEMFSKIRQLDSKMMLKHSSMTEQCDLFMTNGRSSNSLEPEHSRSSRAPGSMLNVSEMLGGINEPQIPQYDECFIPQQMSKMPRRNNIIDISNKKDSGKLQDVIGEVINVDDTYYFRDALDADYPVTWSKQGHEMGQDQTPRPFYQHTCSPSNAGSHPTFPTASEIESDGKRWFPEQAYGKRSGKEITQPRDIVKKKMSGVLQKEILEECVLQNNDMSSDGLSIPCRRTRLSNAIDSTQMQQGSPWTIEFLNRMREKSKQKQQSNPGVVWNEKKITKRKSPSLLESDKVRRGKNTKNGIKLKRQRPFLKQSNAFKAEKPPIPFASSWSPKDERKIRKLAFSTNGKKGQSKLVWER